MEWLGGSVDVFHGTNFVLPLTRYARGVVTVHDLSFLRYPQTVSADSLRYQQLVPGSIRRAAVVCALSNAAADEIAAEYGVERAGDPGDLARRVREFVPSRAAGRCDSHSPRPATSLHVPG